MFGGTPVDMGRSGTRLFEKPQDALDAHVRHCDQCFIARGQPCAIYIELAAKLEAAGARVVYGAGK